MPDEAHRPIDPLHFGACGAAQEVFLSRWLEESIGRLVAPDDQVVQQQQALGAAQAMEKGAAWGGPRKERAVAKWLRALGMAAAVRIIAREGGGGGGSAAAVRRAAVAMLCSRAVMEDEGEAEGEGEGEALPPLLEGIGFEMMEETLVEKIRAELHDARTSKGAAQGGAVSEEEADKWIVSVVRGRGFGARGAA